MDVRKFIRAVYVSAWVGWQVESNWTEPAIFIGLQIIRPIASSMLFPLLYVVGMNFIGAQVDIDYLTYIILGTVFFNPFIASAETAGQIISQDRERYGVLKSIYITESSLQQYLLGRFLAVMLISIFSTSVVMAVVYGLTLYPFQISLTIRLVDVVQLLFAVLSILIGSAAFFYLLPSINLFTNKLHWNLTYYVLGVLYLSGDVLFPVQSLNPSAWPLAYILPVNQSLNVIRAAFGLPVQANILIGLATSVAWFTASVAVFNLSVKAARRKGLLDKIGWW